MSHHIILICFSHLAVSALPARILEKNYYGELNILLQNYGNLQLEFVRRPGCDVIPELTPVCFVSTSVFEPDQAWPRSCVVWTKLTRGKEEGEGGLAAILSYLQHSEKCLLLQVRTISSLSSFYYTLLLFSGS